MSHNGSFIAEDAEPKRHAACDECRKRKLKCSGEKDGCRRCVKQAITCHYSIQKQMGRPPKKRTRVDDRNVLSDMDSPYNNSNLEREWTSANIEVDTFHLCPPVYLNRPQDQIDTDPTSSLDPFHRLRPISATTAPWPDFSTASAASAMLSMNPGFPSMTVESILPNGSQSIPQCPCLSYLYLCLSNLSSLNAFSVTRETITSLHTAARTAQSVIRCEICPLAFATGIQNVMMLGTLLSVIADAWLRVSKADAEVLGKEIAPSDFLKSITDDPQGANATWKQWLRQVVRRSVIGGPLDDGLCEPGVLCNMTPDILSLVREMEDRQHRWHAEKRSRNLNYKSAKFDTSCSTLMSNATSPSVSCSVSTTLTEPDNDMTEEKENIEERDMLCLRIVGAGKKVLEGFEFQAWEYPDGVEPL
ncbi:putative C6 finger domain protein [Talaromyces proteolyticus]|uniref:C6 finger domain protein n=1 Tax=Talaromyces proteolyticus TaxID=1131652 RepID=A0AAD4KI78_9EURO|nr:putative C6 finger domain protein [Talaromyces proteolyticus]KAH8693037.1 putative C6 finger domain protein [Talaromyces proteolyticus]